MFEKVNPFHPDKVADRIAGAIVDLCYNKSNNPKVAVEVLIGHGECNIIVETSESINYGEVKDIVDRIIPFFVRLSFNCVKQDKHLAENQDGKIRCGDNGIFKGSPITKEQKELTMIAHELTDDFPYDGKYIICGDDITICQSNAPRKFLKYYCEKAKINPLGDWTGGINVDCGATNRKLGSDMGDGVTGGGLHGKDLSKADVSVNIYAHIEAQRIGKEVNFHCSIGDEYVNGVHYEDIVEIARNYIQSIGGFEKFAEWGLIR